MSARVVPQKGYLRGGETGSITYLVGGYDLLPDVWDGFSFQFIGSKATSRAEAERVDVRTFQFVVPDHGVAEVVAVSLVCSSYQLSSSHIPSFEFEFVDSFSKISGYLPVNKTPLAVPLVVALGLHDESTNYSAMDRAFIHFYEEDIPNSLKIRAILDDLHQLEDDENLLHICSDLGLHEFMAHVCDKHADAQESLQATWKGRTPLDVARYRACMPDQSGGHSGHSETRNLLEKMHDQMTYVTFPSAGKKPVQSKPLLPKPHLQHTQSRQPRIIQPRHYAHDTDPQPRQRLASSVSSTTQLSDDSGVGIYSSSSVFSGAGPEVQKEKAIGVVRVTRSYSSDVEEGMLQLRVGDLVHILSHADDGKWYGVVGDLIGFFYMTFVDHDNISWQENRKQRVDLPHAEVIRDSTPDRDDIGFLQVKVHDRVQVLATPDSGLWTAEKDGCVGYMYNSDVQLLGDAAQLGWDHAPAEDNWQGRIRTTSIYTKPHRVKFYCTAVKGNSLKGPTALYFKAGDRVGIIDSPTTSSGIWFGKLGRKSGKFLFSDVEVENYAELKETQEHTSRLAATLPSSTGGTRCITARDAHLVTTLPSSTGDARYLAVRDELRSRSLPRGLPQSAPGTRSTTPILPPRGQERIREFAKSHVEVSSNLTPQQRKGKRGYGNS